MTVPPRVLLVCPTLNPGLSFRDWIFALRMQECCPDKILIIDSGSNDDTVLTAVKEGFDVVEISKKEFNHGGTRQKAVSKNQEYEFVVFLTQDAILSSSDSLKKIIQAFADENIAAVCGRQLPHLGAGAVESHARLFNYPGNSSVRSLKDHKKFGVKTAFLSNSFAAYRIPALQEVGGFPDEVIFGEDMYVAAKLLKAGYKLAYEANACVYHSHNYSIFQEAKRYFDMGVFHSREPWIRDEFGSAEKEGAKFMISELRYLSKHALFRIPEAFLRTFTKYISFHLGLAEQYISLKIKKKISMNPGYFKTD